MQTEYSYIPGGVPPKPVKGHKWVRIGTQFEVGGAIRVPNGTKQRFGVFRLEKIEQERPRGRPRLGKTHKRSEEARRRRNARKNRKSGRYRYQGTHLIQNVLEFGSPKNYFGRLTYHKKRYEKRSKPWVDPRHPPSGFRLLSEKSYTLPMIVVEAIERIYSVKPVYKAQPPKVVKRSPRDRTREDSLTRIYTDIKSVEDVMTRPGLIWRLYGEVQLKLRREPAYQVPWEIEDFLRHATEGIRMKGKRVKLAPLDRRAALSIIDGDVLVNDLGGVTTSYFN